MGLEPAPIDLLPAVSKHQNLSPSNPKDLSESLPFPNRYLTVDFTDESCFISSQEKMSEFPPLTDPDANITARIFIVEIGDPDVPALAGVAPPSLLRKHLRGRDDLPMPVSMGRDDIFSVHWPRLVRQEPHTHDDEERIRGNKFWNVETYKGWDPCDLAQNHRRHYPWPDYPNRGYDFLFRGTLGSREGIFHAAHECISFFHTTPSSQGVWTGRALSPRQT